MEYTINGNADHGINFGATGLDEIKQNIYIIISTIKYSVPLDREFGITPPIDEPLPIVKARTSTEIIEAIQKYEPRVIVTKIDFVEADKNNEDGVIVPVVSYKLKEGVVLDAS